MKHFFFLKTISALGLTTALVVAIISNAKQPVQTEAQAEAQSEATSEVLSEGDCIGAIGSEANSFYEFKGINFTPEQEVAYRKISEESGKKAALALEGVETEVMPDAGLNVVVKDGVTVPDDVLQEIFKANDAASLDQVPDSEQIDELNAKYGQYVKFGLIGDLRYTPEQVVERQEGVEEFEAAMLSIFTPEQQQIYLKNIETKRAVDTCNVDPQLVQP